MKNEQLDSLIEQVEGLHSAAWADASGTVSAQSTGFDGDVPCAVVTICQGQLEDLGKLLGARTVRDWAIATATVNLYVVNQGSNALVALGIPDDKPTKTAEKIVAVLG